MISLILFLVFYKFFPPTIRLFEHGKLGFFGFFGFSQAQTHGRERMPSIGVKFLKRWLLG